MDSVHATVTSRGAGRRPRPVVIGLHLGAVVAIVLGSGAVGHRTVHRAAAADTAVHYRIPGPLHRYSECCAKSKDPSMEVY